MAKTDNLMTPEELNARLTPEQRRANCSKAGKASGAKKKQKKALKEIAEAIGTAKAPEEVIAKMQRLGLTKKKTITLDEAIMMAQYGKALGGSVQSANFLAEMKGEKIQKVEQVNIDMDYQASVEYVKRMMGESDD